MIFSVNFYALNAQVHKMNEYQRGHICLFGHVFNPQVSPEKLTNGFQ
jgi:hypothetical protein